MYFTSSYHEQHKDKMELTHQIIVTTRKSFHDIIKIQDMNTGCLTRSAKLVSGIVSLADMYTNPNMMQCIICGDVRVIRHNSVCPCRRVCTRCTGHDCIYC